MNHLPGGFVASHDPRVNPPRPPRRIPTRNIEDLHSLLLVSVLASVISCIISMTALVISVFG
jgi:hypothetical protein